MPQQQMDTFHGVKYIIWELVLLLEYHVLLANKVSSQIPLFPQHHPQLVNSVFLAQQSQLLVHLPEHGLDICSIQPPAYGLLVQEMHSHVCIHHQVKSQHHVPQDIIYNNN